MTRSRGKTQETPMMPAMPPLMILGRRENCCLLTTCSEAMTAPCSRMAAMAEVSLEVVMEVLLSKIGRKN